jgi:hypothetical protein
MCLGKAILLILPKRLELTLIPEQGVSLSKSSMQLVRSQYTATYSLYTSHDWLSAQIIGLNAQCSVDYDENFQEKHTRLGLFLLAFFSHIWCQQAGLYLFS